VKEVTRRSRDRGLGKGSSQAVIRLSRHNPPMRRLLLWIVVIGGALALSLFILDRVWLLVPIGPGEVSNAPTIPPCNGRVITEGITYKFHDPRRGDMVAFRATGKLNGAITPDSSGDTAVALRVIGVPGDQVVGRAGRVYVDGVKADDIETAPFPQVDVGSNEYFLLGDNRSSSEDSRKFGAVQRNAIYGRVLFVYWPRGDFGGVASRRAGAPPGGINC
jgi:signal peptidase I